MSTPLDVGPPLPSGELGFSATPSASLNTFGAFTSTPRSDAAVVCPAYREIVIGSYSESESASSAGDISRVLFSAVLRVLVPAACSFSARFNSARRFSALIAGGGSVSLLAICGALGLRTFSATPLFLSTEPFAKVRVCLDSLTTF